MNSLSLGHHNQLQTAARTSAGSEHMNGNEATSSFEVWNNFFLSAGIPSNVANDYAITFSQHRIKIDMLRDITKEILLDMGIKAMGDIIAILRQAKDICAQNELKGGGSVKISPNTIPTNRIKIVNAPPRNLPVTRPMDPPVSQLLTTKLARSSLDSSIGLAAQSTSSNRIQSRLSLSSGALISAQSKDQRVDLNQTNKRSSSNISDSLAKRLKPAPVTSDPRFMEKTLTVILPSGSTQRTGHELIRNNISNNSMSTYRSQNSVRSRLGPDTSRSNADASSTLLTSKASSITSRQTDLRTSLKSNHRATTFSNHSEHHNNNDNKPRRDYSDPTHRRVNDKPRIVHGNYNRNRSKPAIFDRLN